MSWHSGKRFRRIRSENVDELLNSTNANEQVRRILKESPPILSFRRLDETTFNFILQTNDKYFSCVFKLGQEQEFERRDGSKIKVIYQLVNDSVMKQTIKMPDGKTAYFTREFTEKETKMTVQLEGSDVIATIYYEVVE
ncbi:fatty acid-binding protein-like [Battus philenor]|uniref:fatty acid-binding protein-like n=1 Tax=Battus philenor TaxID=42288 RepID=UPI0035CF6464